MLDLVRDLAALVAIPEHQHRRRSSEGDRADGRADLRADAPGRSAKRRRSCRPATPTPTLTANGWARPASPRCSCTPITTCSRSTMSSEQWQSPPVDADAARRPAVRPGAADDKGAITAQLGAVAAFLKTKGSCRSTSRWSSRARRRSARRTCWRSSSEHQTTPAVRRHRRLRHREHRHRAAQHHLRAARHRGRAGRGARAPPCRSTAAWPAAPWPTRPWR